MIKILNKIVKFIQNKFFYFLNHFSRIFQKINIFLLFVAFCGKIWELFLEILGCDFENRNCRVLTKKKFDKTFRNFRPEIK